MPIPVKFYSVTHEEFQKLQEKWIKQEKEQSEQEGNQVQEADGGIYFVSNYVNNNNRT